jgi:hypothetical protein
MCVRFSVCVQVEALRRADHPSKEFYRLSLIKKLRNQPYAPKAGASSRLWEQEEEKSIYLFTTRFGYLRLSLGEYQFCQIHVSE